MTSDYTPPEEAARLYARYKHTRELEKRLLAQVKDQAARDLKEGATVGQLAKLTSLTDEVFRRIARAEGVERLRPPTNIRNEPPAGEPG
jgi:primosomal protein N''